MTPIKNQFDPKTRQLLAIPKEVDRITENIFYGITKDDRIKTSLGSKTLIGLKDMLTDLAMTPIEVASSIFSINEQSGKVPTKYGSKTLDGLTKMVESARLEFGGETQLIDDSVVHYKNYYLDHGGLTPEEKMADAYLKKQNENRIMQELADRPLEEVDFKEHKRYFPRFLKGYYFLIDEEEKTFPKWGIWDSKNNLFIGIEEDPDYANLSPYNSTSFAFTEATVQILNNKDNNPYKNIYNVPHIRYETMEFGGEAQLVDDSVVNYKNYYLTNTGLTPSRFDGGGDISVSPEFDIYATGSPSDIIAKLGAFLETIKTKRTLGEGGTITDKEAVLEFIKKTNDLRAIRNKLITGTPAYGQYVEIIENRESRTVRDKDGTAIGIKPNPIWSVEVRRTEDSPWEEVSSNMTQYEAEKLAKQYLEEGTYEARAEIPLPLKEGGDVDKWIQEAQKEIDKKGTEGAFTTKAKEHNMTTVEFAKKVLANPDNYSKKTFRQAQFMKNVNHHLFEKRGNPSSRAELEKNYVSKFKIGDVVANTTTKTIGIVRIPDDTYGEVTTDADGNVNMSFLEHYNSKTHKDYHIAPSTKKEIGNMEQGGDIQDLEMPNADLFNQGGDLQDLDIPNADLFDKGGDVDDEIKPYEEWYVENTKDRKSLMGFARTFYAKFMFKNEARKDYEKRLKPIFDKLRIKYPTKIEKEMGTTWFQRRNGVKRKPTKRQAQKRTSPKNNKSQK
jgi:hypothetical protein